MKRAPIILLCLLSFLFLLGSAPALAQQDFGDVAFANSGPSAAQADFLLGLAQLHNFEYDDAAEHFRKAQQIAPDFALAFWGEAMTQNHAVWHEEDVPAARGIPAEARDAFQTALARAPGRKLVVEALARTDKQMAVSMAKESAKQASASNPDHKP